jgi:hypothetical protein
LNAAVGKALDDENVRKRLLSSGPTFQRPRTARRSARGLVKSEIAKWTPVLKPATN